MLNLASLNQRVNALTAKINNIVPGGENLANTLLNGNSAGASDIDMNSQDILDVNNIDLVTINSLPYPPTSAIPTFQQVLTHTTMQSAWVFTQETPSSGNATAQTLVLHSAARLLQSRTSVTRSVATKRLNAAVRSRPAKTQKNRNNHPLSNAEEQPLVHLRTRLVRVGLLREPEYPFSHNVALHLGRTTPNC